MIAERESIKQILVVEDDVLSQLLMKTTLKEKYTVFFAESVRLAKDQLKRNKINLILLDLSLTGDENGLDLVGFTRSDPRYTEVPILALTAHAYASDRENCLAAGCDDYIAKPFDRADLLSRMEELLA